ncbi:peptidase family M3-domain-containing protein [Lasiosphaeria hispida]|uniref:Peptidase family M3-domain-containing protein n=1 Tax=Lasiosphaeria hispida TaxID=260671 RepID=A0AAJ0HED9_9PEZI|nr:peptidase family M3-domain-containing protein [Lasiosphaeria hispida]
MSLQPDLFALVDDVLAQQDDDTVLDPRSRYFLTKLHQDYVDGGLKLPSGLQGRFKSIQARIQQLANQFDENAAKLVGTYIWLTPQEVEGLPDSVLSGLKKGEGESYGKLCVDRRTFGSTIVSAHTGDARRRALVAPKNVHNENSFIHEDGTPHYPAMALLCGFPRPEPNKPCLLGHFDVVQLFHELGHAIHGVVSKTRYARFHRPDGTPVDYGEVPSQMLENWCCQPAQLKAMSKHYSYLPDYQATWEAQNSCSRPPETIPDELIAAALGSGGPKHDALHYLRQVLMCVFDMTIHQPESHEAAVAIDLAELWSNIHQSTCFFDDPAVLGLDEDLRSRGYTIFGHLMLD